VVFGVVSSPPEGRFYVGCDQISPVCMYVCMYVCMFVYTYVKGGNFTKYKTYPLKFFYTEIVATSIQLRPIYFFVPLGLILRLLIFQPRAFSKLKTIICFKKNSQGYYSWRNKILQCWRCNSRLAPDIAKFDA
jgi:hypothetical protein